MTRKRAIWQRLPAAVLGGFFGVLALVFLGTAIPDFLGRRAFRARGVRAEGTVTRVAAASRLNDAQTVTFTAAALGGRVIGFRATPARVPSPVGARVPVLYDPERPEDAEIDRYEEMFHDIFLRAGIGMLLAIAAGGFWSSFLRKGPLRNN